MNNRDSRERFILNTVRIGFVPCLVLSLILIFGPSSKRELRDSHKPDKTQLVPTLAQATGQCTARAPTRPIEQIKVGDRVLAHNPEVANADRVNRKQPNWDQWFHLSLLMPKEDGSALKIELLRPESWVLDHLEFAVVEPHQETNLSILDGPASQNTAEGSITAPFNNDVNRAEQQWSPDLSLGEFETVPLSPLRPLFREIALTTTVLDLAKVEFFALTVEMNLHELGATGTAVITNVASCPPIHAGEGQPVTGTFSHPPSTSVLDVTFSGERKTIGVTENHLFWSVDRQRFLPIGKMKIGEHAQTFHGETKRIEAKLPRPGPEVVYNLEVYGEHVYFVGEQGILAHNMYDPEAELAGDVAHVFIWRARGGIGHAAIRTNNSYISHVLGTTKYRPDNLPGWTVKQWVRRTDGAMVKLGNGSVRSGFRSTKELSNTPPDVVLELRNLDVERIDALNQIIRKDPNFVYRLVGDIANGQCASNCTTTIIKAINAGMGRQTSALNRLLEIHATPVHLEAVLRGSPNVRILQEPSL